MAWQFCAKHLDSACFVVAVSALMAQSKEETDHVFQDSFGIT
jgi:hypothetical protein